MDFEKFAVAVKKRYEEMASLPSGLLVADIPNDTLWLTYLYSFENDPVYKTRGEHDCSLCRHFIYEVGRAVTLTDGGEKQTVWDVALDGPQYQKTADAMAQLIRSASIGGPFLVITPTSGAKNTKSVIGETLVTFPHFWATHKKEYVVAKEALGTQRAVLSAQAEMLEKSMTQINAGSVTEVLELISSNALYRGAEHLGLVKSFQKVQNEWLRSGQEVSAFAWANFRTVGPAVCNIKNSVIGTLLLDLASGATLEDAVKRFETKVAPTNYKRPTALVTPRMVEDAKNTLIELGLYDAIPRRYAALSDISINDVLYADRGAQPRLKNADVFDVLKTQVSGAASPKTFDRVDSVSLDTFLSDVLPLADTVEVFLENKHEKNLVSLVTAVNKDAANLFKWDNPFSWSYNGDLADSHIRERVAAKGGNVTGEVCCRLAWNNYDDLDLHMTEKPAKGEPYKIFYRNKGRFSPSKGKLDVDAMAGGGRAGMPRDPVENIFYGVINEMTSGEYLLQVHQFKLVEKADTGFTIEIDILGEVHSFQSAASPAQSKFVDVATLTVKNGKVSVSPIMAASSQSRKLWGLDTQQWQRVSRPSCSRRTIGKAKRAWATGTPSLCCKTA